MIAGEMMSSFFPEGAGPVEGDSGGVSSGVSKTPAPCGFPSFLGFQVGVRVGCDEVFAPVGGLVGSGRFKCAYGSFSRDTVSPPILDSVALAQHFTIISDDLCRNFYQPRNTLARTRHQTSKTIIFNLQFSVAVCYYFAMESNEVYQKM